MSKIDNIKNARKLARAIASDISIYNTAKIEQGLKDDNLFDVLADELEEGRTLFQTRVSDEIYQNTNIFEKAIIDTVVSSRSHVQTRIW